MRHVLTVFLFLIFFSNCAHAQPSEAFDAEGKGSQLPSTEEYKNIPPGLLLPPEIAEVITADGPIQRDLRYIPNQKIPFDKLREMFAKHACEGDRLLQNLMKLAEGGHHGAEELLGVMYRLGICTTPDSLKAFDYLSRAAENNRPLAQHHLGVMYYTGEGVPVADNITALMWLHIAIVHYKDGPEKDRAKQDRDNIYPLLTRREKDQALEKARAWLTKRGEAHLLDLNPR